MLDEKFYTVADVARVTGLTSRTIRNYLKDGELHGVKVGVQWRFTEDDVRHLFQETDGREDLSKVSGNRIQEFLSKDYSEDSKEFSDERLVSECVILDYFEPSEEKKTSRREKIRESVFKYKDKVGFSYEERENDILRVVLTGEHDLIEKILKVNR
ncbi:MAG: helix-turn-helix domain-containing protein [Lachnospiraceae bacterium]|nr:helix-turn-helix domain-containing protein [Lachnospiraceae bacterium]